MQDVGRCVPDWLPPVLLERLLILSRLAHVSAGTAIILRVYEGNAWLRLMAQNGVMGSFRRTTRPGRVQSCR